MHQFLSTQQRRRPKKGYKRNTIPEKKRHTIKTQITVNTLYNYAIYLLNIL
ncbi:MAG: hypothetical protein L6Q53_07845 [Candidatus Brocadia sinica]|uniref:hypothetical protein n=1 Tax=Candidatus Brocadia TaxID=380240 RepID=UPI0012FEF326|nr:MULTISPECIES: hypothetical protein [Brocadia]MCK6468090.1 hypothetical protein [Candidatus Brocadia sinica]NOG40769.1 hypothetical protein [Planctomycetota bacterium]NUO06168.1 hypothetical protein [Candidatus Brocadia sinica]